MQPNPYANYPANTTPYTTVPYNTQPGYYTPGQPTYPAYPSNPHPAPPPQPGYYPNTAPNTGNYYPAPSYPAGTYPNTPANYGAPSNTSYPAPYTANYGNAAPNYGSGTVVGPTSYTTGTVPPNYNTPSNYTNNYPSTVANYPAPSNYGNPTSPQPNANYPNTGAYPNAQGNYPAVQPSYSSPNLGTPSYAGPYPTNYGYSQPNLHTGVGTSPNYPRGSNSPLSRAASSPVTPVSAARDAVPASSTSGAQEQPLIIVYKKGILKGVDTRNLEITDQALLEVPSEVLQISGLSVFKFSRNRLTAVPKRLCGLGKLTILDLSRNQIKKIPSQIALLNHLRILMLNDNEISEVPLAITSCTALEELHLQGNKIESVPLNLVALDRLVLLDLGLNSLNALSNDLQHWSLLRTLRINDNKFTELPNGIDKLPNLEVLEVQGNPLTQLPANIGELSRLEVLKAGNCQLSSVPASVSRLTSLTALHLNNNKFTELPNEIYQLTALRELCLQSNEVSDVPPHVIKLSQLSYLDLSNNKLQSLPYQIGQMRIATGHTSLRLEGNPFTELIPREIMLQGTPAIISFLRMLNTSKSSWRRVKLVLVGQEEVGKTSLRKALVETSGTSSAFGGTLRRKKSTQVGAAAIQASGDTVATDGIDIEDWTLTGVTGEGATAADPVTGATVSDLTFSCWDFGGQEVYYPTHQFFLTTRSVYMLIFNLVDISASRIEYWLKALKLRAPTAPVVLVGTHLDDKRVADKKVHREILNEMKQKYQSRFPMIRDYCAVSSKNGKGLKELKARLITLALQDPAVNQHVPMSYVALESSIKKIRSKKEIMSLKEFKEFVAESGIEADEDVITVLKFMNDVGVVSYFSKHDREQSRDHIVKAFASLKIDVKSEENMSDIVILNPQWLSDVMSSIVTLKHNYIKDGVLTEQILPHVWRDYPQQLWPILIDLLSHFEVAHRLKRATSITGNKTPASAKRPVGPRLGAPRQAAHSLRQGLDRALEAIQSADGDSTAENSALALGPIIVPCLLPETPPSQLFSESWPEPFAVYSSASDVAVTCPVTPVSEEWIEPIGRDYLFKFLPLGFASRLITRTLQLKGVRPITCWRSGMIVDLDLDKSPQRALLIADEARGRVLVRIRTRRGATGVSRGGLLTLLCDNISTLGQWARARPNIEVPCPHCLASFDTCQTPSQWALTAVLSALRLGDTNLKCHKNDTVTPVTLSTAAPDVMFDFGNDTSFIIEFNRLELLDKVAEGAFAALYRARAKSRDLFNEDPNKVLAVKQLLQQEEDFLTDSFSELQHETFMMCQLQHDCLVALRGISLRPLALVMDFYPLGALDKRLRTAEQKPVTPMLPWALRLKIAQDIARGMAYLHSEDVIHRDLRSPNVLLVALDHNASVAAKVTDFGTAQMLAGSMRGGDLNENWCAPEVLLNQPYDLKADVYSFGIILWELLQIGFPFAEYAADWSGKPTSDFGAAVQKGLRPSIPSHVPTGYSELIQVCWQSDPQKRLNFCEIIELFPSLYAQATKW